jgi:L-amino acid N-acyltransferase YncA
MIDVLVRRTVKDDHAGLEAFLLALPRRDGGFLKADVQNKIDLQGLLDQARGVQLIATDDEESILGYASVLPSVGRSSHVAELRLVVAAGARRRGIGRALARAALIESVTLGLEKLAVEALAEQTDLVEMFMDLGFEPEALMHDFVRDEAGNYADLMILVHPATEAAAFLAAVGIDEDLA